jgi:hypothetical protein
MQFNAQSLFNKFLLVALFLAPCPSAQAATWKEWFVGIGTATGISAGLYWLLKPVSTETLKRDAEKCYTETNTSYTDLLNNQNNTKKLLTQARAIGQTKYRGFWRSLFTSEDNHLGHDAQHRSPLLRGAACLVDDAEQLAKNRKKLDERFGSSDAAKREFHNYGNMLALQASLLTAAKKIKETRDYATAQEQFAQYREQKKLAEAANARLANIEHKLDAQKREAMQRPPAFAPHSPHARPLRPTPSAPVLPEEA